MQSLIGAVRVGMPDSNWPRDADGAPMAGLAQLNLAAAPFVPTPLAGIAFVNIFLERDDGTLVTPDGRPNGDGWLVRCHTTLEWPEGSRADGSGAGPLFVLQVEGRRRVVPRAAPRLRRDAPGRLARNHAIPVGDAARTSFGRR